MISNNCTVIQVVVVIFLMTNIASHPPILEPSSEGEILCRSILHKHFGCLTDGNVCVHNAIRNLRINLPILKENELVKNYFYELKFGVKPGQVKSPENFCQEYVVKGEGSSTSATQRLAIIVPLKFNCKRILDTVFEGKSTNDIVHFIYENGCTETEYYKNLDTEFSRKNPNSPKICVSYVRHVSEFYEYNGVPPSPIEFCRNNAILWQSLISLNPTQP